MVGKSIFAALGLRSAESTRQAYVLLKHWDGLIMSATLSMLQASVPALIRAGSTPVHIWDMGLALQPSAVSARNSRTMLLDSSQATRAAHHSSVWAFCGGVHGGAWAPHPWR